MMKKLGCIDFASALWELEQTFGGLSGAGFYVKSDKKKKKEKRKKEEKKKGGDL
ncbi:hypothetical protein MNB_SV-3-1126 [hydrothermal vent metagenome]|uniref:Uncharacterized protein n=1 Tax=hydrothermal vent metagenome TaxID=652676 RepID=A0A1W1BX89_9ZZZZ